MYFVFPGNAPQPAFEPPIDPISRLGSGGSGGLGEEAGSGIWEVEVVDILEHQILENHKSLAATG